MNTCFRVRRAALALPSNDPKASNATMVPLLSTLGLSMPSCGLALVARIR